MDNLIINKSKKLNQYLISIILIAFVSAICYFLSAFIGYRVVALLLLFSVSILAMYFDILPVLLAALLSALIWDYFFIPPRFTLTVGSQEDALLLLMYFIIAMVNAVLTTKIRQLEKRTQKKEVKEKTSKFFNTLLNSLSQELRTPILTINSATDNLLTHSANLPDEKKMELLSDISKSSHKLENQVDNLLSISRIESGMLKPDKIWCDINAMFHYVVLKNEEQLKHCALIYQVKDDLPQFKLDANMIEQLLHNLIYNAAKYTSGYCVIKLVAKYKENVLTIIVEDNGEGFPDNEIENVFEKFHNIENNLVGGMGLGLYMAKGYVDAHNGTIYLENVPGGGAKFTIEIPTEILEVQQ